MYRREKEIREVLAEVNLIDAKYDFMYRKTGGYFNIFDILNLQADEVRICRLLRELLDPHGCHYQGTLYLTLFFKHVLKMEHHFSESDYQNARVDREYLINGNRRVDLMIRFKQIRIPIEVKIYAGEQENQCKDYLGQAMGADLYYLTIDGELPSAYSSGVNRGICDRIKPISFKNEIIRWLEECLKNTDGRRLVSVCEIIRQLMESIRRMTNTMEESKEKEVVEIISESGKNIKTAMMIEESLRYAKTAMILKVFEELEQKIAERFVFLGERRKDVICDYASMAKSFYDNKKSSWPGLTYCCKKNIKENTDLCFRIEIDHRLFCGFCTPEKNKNAGELFMENEIRKLLNFDDVQELTKTNWWIHWEYLPGKLEAPNFKDANEAWLGLFDKQTFDQFIEICMDKIETVLRMLPEETKSGGISS